MTRKHPCPFIRRLNLFPAFSTLSNRGWPIARLAVRIIRMVAEDENPFSEPRDSAKLLDQAGEKAVMLIGRLMIAQSRIEPAAPRVDVEAMEACRAAMARTLAALHRTVEALGVAAGKNIQ